MKVPHDFIHTQAPKNPATVRRSSEPGCPSPLDLPSGLRHDIMDMLLSKPLIMLYALPSGARHYPPFAVPPQPVDAIFVDPAIPIGGIPLQHFCREDSIASGVLDVDVEVLAQHVDHDIHIYLKVVTDPFLHREGVLFLPPPPRPEFGCYQKNGYYDHADGPFPSA